MISAGLSATLTDAARRQKEQESDFEAKRAHPDGRAGQAVVQ